MTLSILEQLLSLTLPWLILYLVIARMEARLLARYERAFRELQADLRRNVAESRARSDRVQAEIDARQAELDRRAERIALAEKLRQGPYR